MGRSLSLAAYRVLTKRRPLPEETPAPVRPDGELLWMHAADYARLNVLSNLAARIKAQRTGLQVLTTMNQPGKDRPRRDGFDIFHALAEDHPTQARQFLDHWRPDMCLWVGGDLMPNLLTQSAARGIPMVMADLDAEEVSTRRSRWLPDLSRVTLNGFDTILTRDEAAAAVLRRAGVTEDRVRVAARLRTGANPPACNDTDLEETSRDLRGRPVWLSVGTQGSEIDLVLKAHRNALRLVHRMLLILAIVDTSEASRLRDRLRQHGLRAANWDDGAAIGEEVQVVISSDPADLGLWYRVAPTTLVASTFDRQPGGRNPLEAAALGSAVLHGPNTSDFSDAFLRLSAAGAAKEVRSSEALGSELVRLAAPDQAARMALAAWEVATEGAELTDNLIDLVQDHLDRQRAARAGA